MRIPVVKGAFIYCGIGGMAKLCVCVCVCVGGGLCNLKLVSRGAYEILFRGGFVKSF